MPLEFFFKFTKLKYRWDLNTKITLTEQFVRLSLGWWGCLFGFLWVIGLLVLLFVRILQLYEETTKWGNLLEYITWPMTGNLGLKWSSLHHIRLFFYCAGHPSNIYVGDFHKKIRYQTNRQPCRCLLHLGWWLYLKLYEMLMAVYECSTIIKLTFAILRLWHEQLISNQILWIN